MHVDFQVKDALPNVSFPLGRNWAGNIPVGRPNQPNDTLFFWGFEKENGSFTANSTEPWGIWLNGGYVYRSLSRCSISNFGLRIALAPARQVWLGSFSRYVFPVQPSSSFTSAHSQKQNGPLHIANDYSVYSNNYSWDKLADWIWVDQPVYVVHQPYYPPVMNLHNDDQRRRFWNCARGWLRYDLVSSFCLIV